MYVHCCMPYKTALKLTIKPIESTLRQSVLLAEFLVIPVMLFSRFFVDNLFVKWHGFLSINKQLMGLVRVYLYFSKKLNNIVIASWFNSQYWRVLSLFSWSEFRFLFSTVLDYIDQFNRNSLLKINEQLFVNSKRTLYAFSLTWQVHESG